MRTVKEQKQEGARWHRCSGTGLGNTSVLNRDDRPASPGQKVAIEDKGLSRAIRARDVGEGECQDETFDQSEALTRGRLRRDIGERRDVGGGKTDEKRREQGVVPRHRKSARGGARKTIEQRDQARRGEEIALSLGLILLLVFEDENALTAFGIVLRCIWNSGAASQEKIGKFGLKRARRRARCRKQKWCAVGGEDNLKEREENQKQRRRYARKRSGLRRGSEAGSEARATVANQTENGNDKPSEAGLNGKAHAKSSDRGGYVQQRVILNAIEGGGVERRLLRMCRSRRQKAVGGVGAGVNEKVVEKSRGEGCVWKDGWDRRLGQLAKPIHNTITMYASVICNENSSHINTQPIPV
ncbi:hypothetical protein F5148DRAFT_1152980 [Russula earlei]|uniref:Uncharacterized protein n=1 Tax=Russula earlei TaxID=71964 RepID=A0ACC0TVJ4_9AGAM|nr:hypothetical protein F5148DRAFT_1152980 [Russula earlei]